MEQQATVQAESISEQKTGFQAIISMGQLAVLLCVCRLPSILLGLLGDGTEQIWSVLLADAVRILLCLPICFAFSKGWALPERRDGFWDGLFRWVAVLYLLLSLGEMLAEASVFMTDTLYPGSSAFFFGAVLLVLAAYGAHMGLEAAARTALPVLVIFGIGLILTALGVRQEIRLIHLRPTEDLTAVLGSGIRMAGKFPELLILLAVGPKSGGKAGKTPSVLWAFGLSALFTAAASFLCGAVLGGLERRAGYPFFKVETLMKLSIFQRMDAWFLALWVLIFFVRCLFLLWAAEQFLSPFAGKRRKVLLPVLAAAGLAVMALLLGNDGLTGVFYRAAESIWWIPVFFCLLAVLWLRGRQPKRGGKS